jgi:rhodanese-related sulfurtransferase
MTRIVHRGPSGSSWDACSGIVPAVRLEESPRGARTVADLLADARSQLRRLTPLEAHCACADGARLVDIRSEAERLQHGTVPGAHFIPRNALEKRLDPHCGLADTEVAGGAARVILFCQDGFQSSLAAATVRQFGIDATDIIDGFTAWHAAGLPVAAVSGDELQGSVLA